MMSFNSQNDFNGGNDMKRTIYFLFTFICVFTFAANVSADEKYKSLRGDTDIPAKSTTPVLQDWMSEESLIPRTFVHQPPLIPHAVEEYDI